MTVKWQAVKDCEKHYNSLSPYCHKLFDFCASFCSIICIITSLYKTINWITKIRIKVDYSYQQQKNEISGWKKYKSAHRKLRHFNTHWGFGSIRREWIYVNAQ